MSGANLMPMHDVVDVGSLDPCDCTGWTEEDMPLTGLWRADYSGDPFVGTASAGTSGSNDLTPVDATHTPRPWTTGSTVNGYVAALSDGFAQFDIAPLDAMQMTADGQFSDYASAYAFSGWLLVKPTGGGGLLMRCFNRVDGNMPFSIHLASGGALIGVQSPALVDGVSTSPRVTGVTLIDTWNLVTFRYDGINIQIGINEKPGVGTSAAYTTALDFSSGDPLQFGMEQFVLYSQNQAFDGEYLNFGCTDTVMTDEEFCKLVCRMRARYALPLVGPT